jgi:hypothetical protein
VGSIYASALRVIVWLGLGESGLGGFVWIHEVLYPRLFNYLHATGNIEFDKVWNAHDFDCYLGVESTAR